MSVTKQLSTTAWSIRADPSTGLRLLSMRGLKAEPTSGTRLANIHHVSLDPATAASPSHVPHIVFESIDTDPSTRYVLSITHLNQKTREDGSGFPLQLSKQLKACKRQNSDKSDTEKQNVLAGVLCVCAPAWCPVHVSLSSTHICLSMCVCMFRLSRWRWRVRSSLGFVS